MKNLLALGRIIFLLVISFIAFPANAVISPSLMPPEPSFNTPLTANLTDMLNKMITHFDANLNIGLVVQDAMSGKVIYAKNSHRYFMPASNQKLFTALAALYYLSPQFTYQTRLYADATLVQNGVLNGDVYLQFTGDPTFTLTQLDHLISSLTQIGVKQINGKIVVDDTLLDQTELSPGQTWDDKAFCFGAPLSALIINHNCLTATVTPAKTPDQPATLSLPAEPQFIRLVNNVVTRDPQQVKTCQMMLDTSDEKAFIVSGCLKTTDTAKPLLMAIKNPRSYMRSAILYSLQSNHIQGMPNIVFEQINQPPDLIATAASPPLKTLISKMLKDSDNLIANSLFKVIGALYTHEQGTWQNGSSAIHDILSQNLKMSLPDNILYDGSGTSRYNFVTPEQVITLLQRAYTSPYAPDFISSLPVSGVDGTLKTRMTNPTTVNRIRAKTGSETATTSLSGYLITNKKHLLIFTILINGFIEPPLKYKQLEDQICNTLITNA